MRGIAFLAALFALPALPLILCFLWISHRRPAMIPLPFLLHLAAGILALVPAAFAQSMLPAGSGSGVWALLYGMFIRIALTEEMGRLLFMMPLVSLYHYRTPTKEYRSVGAAEGLVAGLSFALAESLSYAVMEPDVVLIRVFTAAPLHGACGSRVGMAAASFARAPFTSFFHFISAVGIHGIYNAMLFHPAFPPVLPVVLAFLALAASIAVIRSEGQ